MGFLLNRIRTRRRGAARQLAAVAVLAAAACGRADAVPTETPETTDGWCVDGQEVVVGFRLENGKTVSICVAAGSSDLTYTYGILGEEPELVYSGPLLGSFEGLSGYSYDIAGLATEFTGPDVSVDASPEAVAAAESGPNSRGFFYVHSLGGRGGEESAYLFKRGGWEYAVRVGYSRNANPDIAAELGDYSEWRVITVTSPEGESSTIR